MGPLGGVYTPGGCMNIQGAYEHMGVYKCTGGVQHGGVQPHPPSINTCLPLKSRKKTLFKAISYT